jgi:AcrR family transcriptional regulator
VSAIEAPYWGREDEPDAAYHRLLDAAGEVFAERGVTRATMSDVAAAAGCSRGTLYRYFADAAALRLAFVEREAAAIGQKVAAATAGLDDPPSLLVEACVVALREVRADPILSSWFDPASSGLAGEVANRARTIARLVEGFLTLLFEQAAERHLLRPGVEVPDAADWVVRVMLSLLAQPARRSREHRSATAAERALLDQFLRPAFFREAR